MKMNCPEYEILSQKLKQHENTITQLLVILAASNKKISDLNKRQIDLEHRVTFPLSSPPVEFVIETTPKPFMTPQMKE
ncbi:hypothetical protein [Aquibacillus salsiterrae]|uniref:Uncharacterized protein n=1 Tax=Aquibacillus salsiterrae TaxID=2950439 RepID=A0A9X4ADY9_9BACI|nr:hypothetical protein [Aquibacillus salsiterrae]MDC3416137.1 hypothetical protein [Aquibacillus salsiterrae]